MTDPYKTAPFGDKQSQNIRNDAKMSRKRKVKEGNTATKRFSSLYKEGVDLFKSRNIFLELSPEGQHVLHKILVPDNPKPINGINYPHAFRPLREIQDLQDFLLLESVLETADSSLKDFWQPLVHPQAGPSDLLSFSERKLKMEQVKKARDFYEVLDYKQTFDPDGKLTGNDFVTTPLRWVPAKAWFSPSLHQVKFEDVFTIFPPAERQLLMLLLGRVGVGRSGHLPPNFPEPIVHTARMGAVIIGNDPGLGKSTLFNSLIAAISRVGLESHTFKSTDDRFGLAKAAMSDIAYKDDTSLKNLRSLMASENTKILITNGKMETEEKFKSSEEVHPRCVLLVNSNDWQPEICYELDPGIIARIKLISTYKEVEIMKRIGLDLNPLCEDSPDLRPFSHLPWLANKLDVSVESLFLWCLRLCTDHFWEIITDTSDPTVNPLQMEVRHWTTRLRIRFKADMSNAFMSALVLSTMIRDPKGWVPREMNYEVMVNAIHDFWFLGVDPSGNSLMAAMKKHWEDSGRIATHPYQAFREVRWESVTDAITVAGSQVGQKMVNDRDKSSKVLKMMTLRDGFSLNTGYSFAISSWQNALFGTISLKEIAKDCLKACDQWDLDRIHGRDLYTLPDSKWMETPQYDPKYAEKLRQERKDELT